MSLGHDALYATLIGHTDDGGADDPFDAASPATTTDRWERVIAAHRAETKEAEDRAETKEAEDRAETKEAEDRADEEHKASAFPGTYVVRDKYESGVILLGDKKGAVSFPRPNAPLLIGPLGTPALSGQVLTYLEGPPEDDDPDKALSVKRLLKAMDRLRDDDPQAFLVVAARFGLIDREGNEGKGTWGDTLSWAEIADRFAVPPSTARDAVARFVERMADVAPLARAAELEHGAAASGAIDPADLPPAPWRAPEDAPFTMPSPLDVYRHKMRTKAKRDAYERGA